MHKIFPYVYAFFACISFFSLAGILRIEESALFSGVDSVPEIITVRSAYGDVILKKTAYALFSLWFAQGTYAADIPDGQSLENSLVVRGGETASFSSAYPEWRVFAVMKARDSAGKEHACNLQRLFGDETLRTYNCVLDKEEIVSLSVVLIKPTSLREKITAVKESF